MPPPPDQHRNLIAIGASAGGLDALSQIVAGLPADLPAAVLIVQHVHAGFGTQLPEVLSARGPLRASLALHGEPLEPGHIYVAPPDNHLLVRPGYVHVVRGPKENGHRPAVDPLFRTASAAYGARAIGVVLTGNLDCGTAGLLSIKARGGVAIAQDPSDAAVPDMPRSAIEHVAVDHVVPASEMAALLARLVREPAGPAPLPPSGRLGELEGDEPGTSVGLACPLCKGSMTVSTLGDVERVRCHVGHSFSLASLAVEQAEATERALWAAVRALDESAALAGRLASRSEGEMRRRFEEKQITQERDAARIRDVLLGWEGLNRDDAAAVAVGAHEPPEGGAREPDDDTGGGADVRRIRPPMRQQS